MNTTKTNRRAFLKSLTISTATLALGGEKGLISQTEALGSKLPHTTANIKKPNVIIVFSDQLRSFALGCYGNDFVRSPNIDKLAQGGFRFEHGISNSPTCVPARSNILSGQYCRTCVGARANEMSSIYEGNDRLKFPDITLPEVFKKMGYKTAEVGKWHIDTKQSILGFDEVLKTSRDSAKKDAEGSRYLNQYRDLENVKSYIKENRDKPFFLYYNILSPHMPIFYNVPDKYTQMYSPEKVPLRKNVWKDGKLAYDERWFHIYRGDAKYDKENESTTHALPACFTLKELTALYYGAVTWVDDLVGELAKSLKENGVEDNTIIVFSADHGDLLGSHHLWNKARLYEEAIRIPMIYSWPAGIKKGAANKTQVASLIDVMPTLLSLCGSEIPKSVQGKNLAPVLRGKNDVLSEDYTFIETPYREIGIRTPTHLFGAMVTQDDKAIEDDEYLFFDLEKDPYEENNLAKTDQEKQIAQELKKKLIDWNKNTHRLKGVKYNPWV
jgi:arylsulfatase A-like enzyme